MVIVFLLPLYRSINNNNQKTLTKMTTTMTAAKYYNDYCTTSKSQYFNVNPTYTVHDIITVRSRDFISHREGYALYIDGKVVGDTDEGYTFPFIFRTFKSAVRYCVSNNISPERAEIYSRF